MRLHFTIIISLFAFCVSAQERFTLSGYVKDGTNGESLIGATVYIQEIGGGTVTNVYGYYSITLDPGEYNVEYRYVGFQDIRRQVILEDNQRIDIELSEADVELAEVVISAEREDANVTGIEMSTAKLDIKTITKLPAFAGEVDIVKSIQLLPGVSTVGEGASGFNVRGGGVGQNLVLLDEAPVYQSSHLFGFFSVFNPDAVKDVKLYKGGIPAQYGGRLSSILDIRMKEGNSKEYDVSGGVGTVFSRLAIEGPIKKDKSSFIVAGRRSYADVIAKLFTDALDDGVGLYFYDLTAKTNYNFNDKNRVYLSGYFGRDVFKFDEQQGFDWGNKTGTFRWNHLFSDRFFSNFTAFYSNYNYAFAFGENELDTFSWESRIITHDVKSEFTYFLNTRNEVTFGADLILYRFKPANAVGVSDGVRTDISLDERKALEGSVYIGNNHTISDRISAQYGIRYSMFDYLGGTAYTFGDTIPGLRRSVTGAEKYGEWESISVYHNLEPRLSLKYQLNSSSSLKLSYNRMNQYIHLISNTVASTPIDVWQPSTNNIKPQQGDQVAVGYFRNFASNLFETSAEVYFKRTKNHVDYIDGSDIFINEFLEGELLTGKGRAYGLELYLKKTSGRFNGWISYTLGKSELLVDGINYGNDVDGRKGQWYPARFDQRHNMKITTNYQLTDRISVSGIFTFISGTPTTFPTDRFVVQDYVIPLVENRRNNVRIPDYHRLDISFTIDNVWRGDRGRSGQDNLVFAVYNLYGRENPFAIYFSQGSDRFTSTDQVETSARQVAILGTIFPSIAYNFKF